MLINPALPSRKFSSPMTNSLKESSPSICPSSQPLPQPNILPKTPVHFPISITTCKHGSKFVTCSPSHGDFGEVSRLQRHSYKVFRLRWIKWQLKWLVWIRVLGCKQNSLLSIDCRIFVLILNFCHRIQVLWPQ